MRKFTLFLLLLLGVSALPGQQRRIVREIRKAEDSIAYHAGFYLYDPARKKVLVDYNGGKYFTPASNTKIFTLYTSLSVLGDSIPGIFFRESADSLVVWGTGDPSLFYERAPASAVIDFLKDSGRDIYISDVHFAEDHFGPGWAWDDYAYSYQVERAALPLFGNYFYVRKNAGKSTLEVDNPAFKNYFWLNDSTDLNGPVLRQYGSNQTDYFPRAEEEQFVRRVPFRYDNLLAARLLQDTLHKKVRTADIPLSPDRRIRYSVPSDSLYKVLMQQSDNFIAEQLLLTVSGILADTLDTDISIRYAKENLLSDLPDEPLWYDGSGLSRYNQFTPRSVVRLWEKLYGEFGSERLFPLLATGGRYGTIANLYRSDPPFIYGKTGTLRNHHSLSGYLVTDKGNTLIFAFMNGHYPGSSSEVKRVMDRILREVKKRY